ILLATPVITSDAPGAVANQVYVLTLTITAGAGAGALPARPPPPPLGAGPGGWARPPPPAVLVAPSPRAAAASPLPPPRPWPPGRAKAAFTVESRNWLRILAATATLATDANVASRVLSLDFINARGTTYLRNFAPLAITASTPATVFHWSEQLTSSEWNTSTP